MKRNKLLTSDKEWTEENVLRGWDILNSNAVKKYSWSGYPVQFEVLRDTQMIDMMTSHFMPLYYSHWSFGQEYEKQMQAYSSGRARYNALEVIINTNPCICYIHEDNSLLQQLIVTAHAAVGHNHFFKNNYLFQEWTHPEYMVDYLLYAKKYIRNCEEQYSIKDVSTMLDFAHLFAPFSVFKYLHKDRTAETIKKKHTDYIKTVINDYNPLLDGKFTAYKRAKKFGVAEQTQLNENLLAFLAASNSHQSYLLPWHKELFTIVSTIQQYFYPQIQTKMMNEGFATYCEYKLMNDLHSAGYLSDGDMLAFYYDLTQCCGQADFNLKYHNHINPYFLGFKIFSDIHRFCTNPTDEDKEFCPEYCNTNPIETINFIVANYRDASFVLEFLSPKLIRDLKLFSIETTRESDVCTIGAIHRKEDYNKIRQTLSAQYSWDTYFPSLEVRSANSSQLVDGIQRDKDTLHVLLAAKHENRFTDTSLQLFKRYLEQIWKHPVLVTSHGSTGDILQCP